MKMITKPFDELLSDRVERLFSSVEGADFIESPAMCVSCGQSWGLRLEVDGQFLHTHKCGSPPRSPKYVVRIVVEPIGETKYERECLKASWKNRLVGNGGAAQRP